MVSMSELTGKNGETYLANVTNSWGLEADGIILVIEVATIEVEEFEKNLAKMMFRNKASALDLWHELKHTDNQANDSKATDTSVDRFIETSHEEKVLNNCHKDRHRWILFLPFEERVNGIDTSEVLKRDVNFETSKSVDKFDQRDSSVGDNLNRLTISHMLRDKELLELVQPTTGSQVGWRTTFHVARGTDNQIHVSGWKI